MFGTIQLCRSLLTALLIIGAMLPAAAYPAETTTYSEGFETTDGGYTSDGTAGWQWGVPANPAGPAAAHAGQKCWGTAPATKTAGTVEGNLYSAAIQVPTLSKGEVARIRFYAYLDMNYEQYGEGDVYISADGMKTWKLLGRFYEKMAGGWQRYVFNVSEYSGKTVNLRFRAYIQNTDPGMYVDDVALTVEDMPSLAKLLTLEASEDAASNASCPWVFTWDGNGFVRDNDIYPVARYPQGEMRDYYLLQRPLVADNGLYNVEIREVESEDSWTDLAGLLAVDHHHDVAVAPDGTGKVIAYRPAKLVKATAAADSSGATVLAQLRTRDGSGVKAYSGDFVELEFAGADTGKGARVLLRVRGFNRGSGVDKPFIGPPAVVVQVRDANDDWQEVGRLNPRFDWSEGMVDLSGHLPDRRGKNVIRLTAISHGAIYHELDFAALATGPQPEVTVTELPLVSATLGGSDVAHLLRDSDNEYVHLTTGNAFALSFAELPKKVELVRDFILVSEGYYIPNSSTYFIYTWDGSQWLQRDSYSFGVADSTRTFDLSSVLPDPAGDYKVRIWQDYSNFAAAIDFVGLQVGSVAQTLATATDLRTGTSILPLVRASDDVRLSYPADPVTKQPRNRWTEYRWGSTATTGPDLTLSEIVVPPTIAPGQQVTVPVTVNNLGNAPALNVAVKLYLSADSTITGTDRWLASVFIGSLAAGASQTLSLTFSMPSVTSGNYFLGAVADPTSVVAELDETNNALGKPVVIGAPVVRPDLVITEMASPATIAPGQQVTVPVTVRNQGTAPAQNVSVKLYFSVDSTVTATDRWLASVFIGSLAAGAQQTLNLSFTGPTVAGGNYFIGAITDPTNIVAESDETNNVLAKPVAIALSVVLPDLVITALSVPSNLAPGQQVSVPATVRNRGTGPALNVAVKLYFSLDSTIAATDRWMASAFVGSLAAGAEQTFNLVLTVPAVTQGSYFLGAIADPVNVVPESDETNNTLGREIAVALPAGLPDLVVTAVAAPAGATSGQQVTVPVTVRNQGTAISMNFGVKLYFSVDSTITATDRWAASTFVGSLAAGAQQTFNLVFTMPATTPGNYFIGAIADPTNGVAESDESNNALGKPFAVSPL